MTEQDYEIKDFLRKIEGCEISMTERKTTAVSTDTLIRTAILIVALINQILAISGHAIIPIDNKQLSDLINVSFTIVTAMLAWWKNNSFTEPAIKADEMLRTFKEEAK